MRSKSDTADVYSLAQESAVASLITQVGARVLEARKAKRYSRRELSERSGVSTRYLVQLEAGEGNISIGLLKRICMALDLSIDSVVSEEHSHSEDVERMVALYQTADARTRLHAMRVLDPDGLRSAKAQRVCLIGLRGAGKSTLGAGLAQSMDVPFIELTAEIEHSAGIPLGEIMALYGEEGFRTLEAETLKSIIASHERLVLAVAGGLVEQHETFNNVLARCHSIWLKADPAEHMERVRAQGDLRPMAGNPQAMVQLREILLSRESRYRQAEWHLDTSGKKMNESLAELEELVAANDMFTSDVA